MLTAVQARMRRSGPGWVGGYVMDGRDTVIGLPKQGVDCRRPDQGCRDPGRELGVMYLSLRRM